jgi:AAA+ superfamily predicted ATPase
MLVDPKSVEEWSRRHHGRIIPLVRTVAERYPLLILHGDVGTGKTVTAEVAANELSREMGREGALFKLSTRVRGAGHVGQMSMLINQAFDIVTKEAGKSRLSFLILDEADSLTASRVQGQSHHEDKVAVNTFIQKIDFVRGLGGQVLLFLCTNRFDVLDPAIVRRAGRVEQFNRPNDDERKALIVMDCDGIKFSNDDLAKLVRLTGPDGVARPVGFTYSDLRTRLFPEALGAVFPKRELTGADLIAAAEHLEPSPATIKPEDRE